MGLSAQRNAPTVLVPAQEPWASFFRGRTPLAAFFELEAIDHLNVRVLDDHRLSNDELTDEIYEVVQLARVKF